VHMLIYLGTQTSTILYFNSRLPESNRGHVNILINDWIVYDDRPYCVRSRRSRRVEPATIKIADVQDDQNEGPTLEQR